MFIECIRSIRIKSIFSGLDIISNKIGTITGLEDFTTWETFYIHDKIIIEEYGNISSRFGSTQLRLTRKVQIKKIFDKKVSIFFENKSLVREFERINFHHRRDFKIFFDSTNKFNFIIHICIEINSSALKSDFGSISSHNRMSIIWEIIIYC